MNTSARARERFVSEVAQVLSGDPDAVYTVFVADGVRIERSASVDTRIEVHAFGERIALKRSSAALRTAEALPFGVAPELPIAGGLVLLTGLLAWSVRANTGVLVIRRPATAGVASLLVVVLVLGPAPPPARAPAAAAATASTGSSPTRSARAW